MSKINETNYPRRTQANYANTDMLVLQAAGGNTYTTRLEDMREDYEATLAPTLSALQDDVNENLATIEGSTASKAYAKGDFLVFGGKLCKAKTSIASGATLVLDTNIELDSVGDELTSLNSQLTSLIKTATFYFETSNVVANNTYQFDLSARMAEVGASYINGVAIRNIYGSDTVDYQGTLSIVPNTNNLIYYSKSNNGIVCIISGVFFYS